MKTTLLALAATGLLASGAATAATGVTTQNDLALTPVQYRAEERSQSINEREARINERIERGMRDGRITEREARHLHRQMRDVEAKERDFRHNNGRIGPREADELNRDLDRLADNVRRLMRNEQRY